MGFTVKEVGKGSAAAKAGLRAGDIVTHINGEALLDYIDYVYLTAEDRLTVTYERGNRTENALVKKDPDEILDLDFCEGLLGRKRVCANHCVFCFVDQLPKGMRKSLYVKDEDWRYSFIMGNYVTLSDIPEEELERIIKRKASPIYISVHAVDEALHKKLIGNPNARPVKETLLRLRDGGISFHAQAVICPGLNDGAALQETMEFLYSLYPYAASLAVVPVGLTRHREGRYTLRAFDNQSAAAVLVQVHGFAKKAFKERGTRFVFASDELYIRAGETLPDFSDYEDFAQIENGVGLVRKFEQETDEALHDYKNSEVRYNKISAATGTDAYPFIRDVFAKIALQYGVETAVYPVENRFFGKTITVSGLLTGQDICDSLKGRDLGEALLLPECMLKEKEDVFLDNMKIEQMKEVLGVEIIPVPVDGYALVETLIILE